MIFIIFLVSFVIITLLVTTTVTITVFISLVLSPSLLVLPSSPWFYCCQERCEHTVYIWLLLFVMSNTCSWDHFSGSGHFIAPSSSCHFTWCTDKHLKGNYSNVAESISLAKSVQQEVSVTCLNVVVFFFFLSLCISILAFVVVIHNFDNFQPLVKSVQTKWLNLVCSYSTGNTGTVSHLCL